MTFLITTSPQAQSRILIIRSISMLECWLFRIEHVFDAFKSPLTFKKISKNTLNYDLFKSSE